MTPPVVRYLLSNPITLYSREVYRTCQVEVDGVITETISPTQPTGYPRGFMLRDDGTITVAQMYNSTRLVFWYYDSVQAGFDETGLWYMIQGGTLQPALGNWDVSNEYADGVRQDIQIGTFGSFTVDDIRYGRKKGVVAE